MINNVTDLKNRTLVESNTIKSFILASNNQFREPNRDDILIHDYQIANSVTINSILSNYIVNLKYAWNLYDNPPSGQADSYFQLVGKLEEEDIALLDDKTRLIMEVDESDGSFKSRKLDYVVDDVYVPDGTIDFVNLDTVWYGIVRHGNYDNLFIVKDMNNFYVNPNPFGTNVNPFDKPLSGVETVSNGLNGYLQRHTQTLNCIVENLFYSNKIDEERSDSVFGHVIPRCKYLLCIPSGFYGLQPLWEVNRSTNEKTFTGFKLHNVGSLIPNIDGNYNYLFCGFHVVGGVNTLFVVFKEDVVQDGQTIQKYHYVYFNDETYDKKYGLTPIKSIVVDQFITEPDEVFNKVECIKSLDSVNIALTDYGFWDLEPNQTKNITYSFRGRNIIDPETDEVTGYTKTHTVTGMTNFNGHQNKLMLPTTNLGITYSYANDKVVEYDKIWQVWAENNKYYKNHYVGTTLPSGDLDNPRREDYPEYLKQIFSKNNVSHDFVGGTRNFAVYNSNGSDPAYILTHPTFEQFMGMLFSVPDLINPFIAWLYDQVVYCRNSEETRAGVEPPSSTSPEWCAEYGEYYLWNRHPEFCGTLNGFVTNYYFPNLEYQVVSSDGLIPNGGKFSSVKNLVVADSGVTNPTLYQYCETLYNSVNQVASALGWKWLIKTSENTDAASFNAVKAKLMAYFHDTTYPMEKREVFINDVLDTLIEDFPLLGYFRSYLKLHFENDFAQSPVDGTVDVENLLDVIESVQDYIKGLVQTSLVLGSYRDSGTEDNTRYTNLNSYIYQNQVWLNRSDIQGIMSATNVKNEVVSAVKSTPFFNEYDTYGELSQAVAETPATLFNMTVNADFAAQSKYTTDTKINVNWATVKDWLIPSGGISKEDLLKTLIRTQLYRPIYFNPTDYDTFTTDPTVYQCTTDRYYYGHDGIRHPLKFATGTHNVLKTESELFDVAGKYTIPIDRVKYIGTSNVLEYFIHYDPIRIVDGKFVYDDVEYYAVKILEDPSNPYVNSIYFNEFQKEMQSKADQVVISGNQFTLNGKTYKIELDGTITRLSVGSATEVWDDSKADEKEFKCEISKNDNGDEQFRIDGVWYILEKSGEIYTKLKYAKVDDNLLRRLQVTSDGYTEYRSADGGTYLQFQFDNSGGSINWDVIYVFRKYQTGVINRVSDEWCYFDDNPSTCDFTESKTFDWYLSNEICRMMKTYPTSAQLSLLGHGVLYSGNLECDGRIKIVNEMQGSQIITKCILVKTVDGDEVSQLLGDMFDKDLNEYPGRVIKGSMGSDGLVNTSGTSTAFIVKEMGNGYNNCNTAWTNWTTWANSHSLVEVGVMSKDSETGEMWASFTDMSYDLPKVLRMYPVRTQSEYDSETYETTGYNITTTLDGTGQYFVNYNGESNLHLLAKGQTSGLMDRYVIDLNGRVIRDDEGNIVKDADGNNILEYPVKRFVFSEFQVHTLDFNTSYQYEQLRENLLINTKQFMMNMIVQKIMDSRETVAGRTIAITPDRPLGLYLDLFSDSASLDNYLTANSNLPTVEEQEKFMEVYKNNLVDIDESNIFNGNLFQYLQTRIGAAFGTNSQILIVDSPSIQVRRVNRGGGVYEHTFTYEVVFDLYMMQNKELARQLLKSKKSKFNNTYVIGNAMIKDVHCTVEFVPKLEGTTMKYDVLYTIVGDTASTKHKVYFDQIYYNLDGKTRHKSVTRQELANYVLTGRTYPGSGYLAKGNISTIPEELVKTMLENDCIFTTAVVRDLLMDIHSYVPSTTGLPVDIQILFNTRAIDTDGIWQLGTHAPTQSEITNGKLSSIDYGHTLIKGDLYNVNETGSGSGYRCWLQQATGSKRYDVVDVQTHMYDPYGNLTLGTIKLAKGGTYPGITNSYLNTHFTLGSITVEGTRQVYLDYNNEAFNGITLSNITFNKASIVNVDKYDLKYGVALPGSFSYKLADADDVKTPVAIGDALSESQFFEISTDDDTTIDNYDNDRTITFTNLDVTGQVVYERDEDSGEVISDNEWIGVPGKINITIATPKTNPTLRVTSASAAYSIGDFPQIGGVSYGTDEQVCEISVVTPIVEVVPAEDAGVSIEETLRYEDDGSEENIGLQKKTITITFKIRAYVQTKYLISLKTGDDYIYKNILVTGDNASGTMMARDVLKIIDFKAFDVGTLNFGWVQIPSNLGASPRPKKNEFTWTGLVMLNWTSGLAFSGDGIDAPCDVQVLKAGEAWTQDGEIYNRQYQVDKDVILPPASIDLTSATPDVRWTDAWNAGKTNFWMDKASTEKSIRCQITHHTWRRLIYNTSTPPRETDITEIAVVPQNMREKIKTHVDRTLALSDEYFDAMLGQLKQFLELIRKELISTITVQDVRNLCKFKYNYTVTFRQHLGDKDNWMTDATDNTGGLFGFRNAAAMADYDNCKFNFNQHLYNQFFNDFSRVDVEDIVDAEFAKRDYVEILTRYYTTDASIFVKRRSTLEELYRLLNDVTDPAHDLIHRIYGGNYSGGTSLENWVRYINAIETDIQGAIIGMFVADDYCHLLSLPTGGSTKWYKFESTGTYASLLFDNKRVASGDYVFSPEMVWTDYPIAQSGILFKLLNRDLSNEDKSAIRDAYAIRCHETNDTASPSTTTDLWYISELNGYVYSTRNDILDMAYEQNGNSLYVLFNYDHYLYRFDNLEEVKDFNDKMLLQKENATMKIETFHSVSITNKTLQYDFIYLDYTTPEDWTITLYGKKGGKVDIEVWGSSPGKIVTDFLKYNVIFFGDSLFDEGELRFQNISKNKDMFDILDVGEVDGCYYGLFKDEINSTSSETLYTVFKTTANGGIVQKLPYHILNQNMYQTSDTLYRLYVVTRENSKVKLREISVPDSDIYTNRVIELQDIMEKYSKEPGSDFTIDSTHPLEVHKLIMSKFKLLNTQTSFFVLSNKGFHRIFYKNVFEQVSIDRLTDFKDALAATLKQYVIGKHLDEWHHGKQSDYFDVIAAKINQFDKDFNMFQLIPTEFTETQDIGVIPDSKVDDTDYSTDHRGDSIQVSTDILHTAGMYAQTDTNPGLITAAVSNPATTYDDDSVFTKSQRNPSIEGSEFYDYIYDQKGNALMDLYQIPFIYIINSNNTYDLYINVPTTRTKYLNRIAGTLKDDLTTQVLKDDTRTRRNFLDEPMANNLDESTTKLRIYIDKKYISIGNVELVEISGNSIPLQIYRDVPNNSLYDSIALESRWDGEVVEINEPSKDINKVMLEFECYGTDSQSIHIKGKTLINHSLNDRRYKFG